MIGSDWRAVSVALVVIIVLLFVAQVSGQVRDVRPSTDESIGEVAPVFKWVLKKSGPTFQLRPCVLECPFQNEYGNPA
jgi:hypothetical protein